MIIEQCLRCNQLLRIQSHGVLSDGSSYISSNLANQEESAWVGLPLDRDVLELQVTNDVSTENVEEGKKEVDWWLKTKLYDESYVVSAARGFHV